MYASYKLRQKLLSPSPLPEAKALKPSYFSGYPSEKLHSCSHLICQPLARPPNTPDPSGAHKETLGHSPSRKDTRVTQIRDAAFVKPKRYASVPKDVVCVFVIISRFAFVSVRHCAQEDRGGGPWHPTNWRATRTTSTRSYEPLQRESSLGENV